MRHINCFILSSLIIVTLGGCRLNLVADTGGTISSSSGSYDCGGGNTCENEIEQSTSETFTAIAKPGYRFVGWTGFCIEGLDTAGSDCSVSVPEELVDEDLTAVFRADFNRLAIGSWTNGVGADQSLLGWENLTFFEDGTVYLSKTAFESECDFATNPGGGSARFQSTIDYDVAPDSFAGNWVYEGLENSIGECSGVFTEGTTYFDGIEASEDELTLYVRERFGGGVATFSRVASGIDEAIQGTWIIGAPSDYRNFVQITFQGGFYSVSQYCDNGPDVGGGLQLGTYVWDPVSGTISVTVVQDTLDGCGLYDMAADKPNVLAIKPAGGSSLSLMTDDGAIVAKAHR